MSSANTKVYNCSICQDDITYNRKQFLKHIKSPEHTKAATNIRVGTKIKSKLAATMKNHKQSRGSAAFRTLRRANQEIFVAVE